MPSSLHRAQDRGGKNQKVSTLMTNNPGKKEKKEHINP